MPQLTTGMHLMYVGRFDEGIAEARRALDLDPLSLAFSNALGGRLLLAGRDHEAIEHPRESKSLTVVAQRRFDQITPIYLALVSSKAGRPSTSTEDPRVVKIR